MDECSHTEVQSWKFEDGESARFWSCSACGRKFVPLDLAQERDAKRYQIARTFVTSDRDLAPGFKGDISTPEGFDASIDYLGEIMRAGDTHG